MEILFQESPMVAWTGHKSQPFAFLAWRIIMTNTVQKEEDEADTFASDMLIPRHQWRQFIMQRHISRNLRTMLISHQALLLPGFSMKISCLAISTMI